MNTHLSTFEFLSQVPDEAAATAFLEKRRWGDTPRCPRSAHRNTATLLRDGLLGAESIAVRFNKGTSRMFFVLLQPTHRERIKERIQRMLDGPWGRHFERAGGINE